MFTIDERRLDRQELQTNVTPSSNCGVLHEKKSVQGSKYRVDSRQIQVEKATIVQVGDG